MEDVRKQSSVMNLEVKASFVSQSHYLLKYKSDIFNEKWVDERVHYFRMFVPWMLI